MLIAALLAVLGVNLIVIVFFVAFVVSRKRWVMRQPGVFHGAIRVQGGDIPGLGPKWHRGYGRWVRDVLVWTKAPFLFRNELLPIDSVEEQSPGVPGAVKRLGKGPTTVVRLKSGAATAEVTGVEADAGLLLGPYKT